MAARPTPVYRPAHEAEMFFRLGVVTTVPRREATRLDDDIANRLGAAGGILFGVLLCSPFWVGVYAMLF
jgi:hypothetical protein